MKFEILSILSALQRIGPFYPIGIISVKRKVKTIPVRGRGGPCGCETSRLPHFLVLNYSVSGSCGPTVSVLPFPREPSDVQMIECDTRI
jgi:hypothetical protein